MVRLERLLKQRSSPSRVCRQGARLVQTGGAEQRKDSPRGMPGPNVEAEKLAPYPPVAQVLTLQGRVTDKQVELTGWTGTRPRTHQEQHLPASDAE